MRKLCFFFLVCLQTLFVRAEEHSIVFVHIGKNLPAYLKTAVTQARLFNPKTPIYIVANEEACKNTFSQFEKDRPFFISCESLRKSSYHLEFNRLSQLDKVYREGFWQYAMERFFYLDELMTQYQLQNVIHLESDVMLYANLEELLPTFQMYYQGIGATFDNDDRCIPGVVFIKNPQIISQLTKFIAMRSSQGETDMQAISNFKKANKKQMIDHLPIISRKYVLENSLVSILGHKVAKGTEENYCNHVEAFHSIFDAAALGQYLGGTDPRNQAGGPGFINESCVFNVSKLDFEWMLDDQGRKVPYAIFHGEKIRINNLHVHCKDLEKFLSK